MNLDAIISSFFFNFSQIFFIGDNFVNGIHTLNVSTFSNKNLNLKSLLYGELIFFNRSNPVGIGQNNITHMPWRIGCWKLGMKQ